MKRLFLFLAPLLLVLITPMALGRQIAAQDGGRTRGPAIENLSGCGANIIAANDDHSTLASLPFTLNFFGTNYSSVYLNTNGNVTFDSALPTYIPFSLVSTGHVIIAPFFADVDTRGLGNGLVTYGSATYSGHSTFCANWPNVGYYQQHTDKLNNFQLLLIDRSDVGQGDFDIMMNYSQIQWESSDSSGGTGGLGGVSARTGYSNGSNVSYELPGSAVNGAFLDSTMTTGLIDNSVNSTQLGRYVFQVRCGDTCTAPADSDGDGCTDARELQTAPGSQTSGGLRDPNNFWDYAQMPTNAGVRDNKIRINDVSAIVLRYHMDEPNGSITRLSDPLTTAIPTTGYHPAFDRGGVIGAHPWNLGPPDGKIRISDVSAVVLQYHHDCA